MTNKRKKDALTVVIASSEAVPYSKTGGLAEVAGSLSAALAGLGHETHLFSPLYRVVKKSGISLPKKGVSVEAPISTRYSKGEVLSLKRGGVHTHFIKNDTYYDRDHLYNTQSGDYADNAERFIFFSRAVLEGIRKLGIRPDVIHVNDWQTSLIPIYMRTIYKKDPDISAAASLLTIHNLGYQGVFWKLDWHLTGLDWKLFNPEGLEFYDKINFLKGGIVFSDVITTVSETYARDITTPEHGWGLDGILRSKADDLHGVLNGIDTDVWNPATDKLIPAKYTADDLGGKRICKAKLLEEMGLPPGDEPVLGVISRLVEQKGFDILAPVVDRMLENGVKLVLLGSGREAFETLFKSLAEKRPDNAAVRIGYDEGLAHRIEAGADMFLMPSHYEPCGLNQMYSLAYGTAPVVRATGGLNDTVRNFDPVTGKGNGFKFEGVAPEALREKVMEALNLYRKDPAAWRKMMVNGMNEDHSWASSSRMYEKLYRQAAAKSGKAAL